MKRKNALIEDIDGIDGIDGAFSSEAIKKSSEKISRLAAEVAKSELMSKLTDTMERTAMSKAAMDERVLRARATITTADLKSRHVIYSTADDSFGYAVNAINALSSGKSDAMKTAAKAAKESESLSDKPLTPTHHSPIGEW